MSAYAYAYAYAYVKVWTSPNREGKSGHGILGHSQVTYSDRSHIFDKEINDIMYIKMHVIMNYGRNMEFPVLQK